MSLPCCRRRAPPAVDVRIRLGQDARAVVDEEAADDVLQLMDGLRPLRLTAGPPPEMAHVVELAAPLVKSLPDDGVRVLPQALAETPEHRKALCPVPAGEPVPGVHRLHPVAYGGIGLRVLLEGHQAPLPVHSGYPYIRDRNFSSSNRPGLGIGSCSSRSLASSLTTSSSRGNGRPQLLSKKSASNGKRGRCPPASGSSAG